MSSPIRRIVVDNVSKRYRLYKERSSSLKEVVTRRSVARYDEFWALKDVSLEIEPGTVYGLVGHNGSGKSTLLRMMAGIQQPGEGQGAHQRAASRPCSSWAPASTPS